jgi:4-amino-4-deoxy-L-arabinose transferase-like glycosyltransferase
MTDDAGHARASLHLAILLIVCALAFFIALGHSPVHRVQEARVLETAREMLENHDPVLPRLGGQARVEKPPLAYWLALGGFLATGTDEAGGRLYSALSGTLTVILVYALGSSWGRAATGLWAGLILATSRLFMLHSRLAETDVLLTLAVTAAMYCFWRAFVVPQKNGHFLQIAFSGWVALGWGAMAVGFLAKGPAGLLFPLVSVVLFLCAARRWAALLRVFNPLGMVLFLTLVVPWFIEVMRRQGMAAGVFWHEMAAVVTGQSHGPANVVYALFYYPIRIWPDFAPWSIFLVPVLMFAWRSISTEPGAQFLLAWTIGILVQLEVIGSRQAHYLLPVFPALALLSGYWFEWGAAKFRVLAGPWRGRAVAGLGVAALALSTVWIFWGEAKIQPANQSRRDFARAIEPVIGSRNVYFYGFVDPVIDFYLRRVISDLDGGPAELDRLAGASRSVFVIAEEGGKAGAGYAEARLAADSRFRLVISAAPPGPSLRLYRSD